MRAWKYESSIGPLFIVHWKISVSVLCMMARCGKRVIRLRAEADNIICMSQAVLNGTRWME